jgi:hypothetical protein
MGMIDSWSSTLFVLSIQHVSLQTHLNWFSGLPGDLAKLLQLKDPRRCFYIVDARHVFNMLIRRLVISSAPALGNIAYWKNASTVVFISLSETLKISISTSL